MIDIPRSSILRADKLQHTLKHIVINKVLGLVFAKHEAKL